MNHEIKGSEFEGESHLRQDFFGAAGTGQSSFIETLGIFDDCNFVGFIAVHAFQLDFRDLEEGCQGLLNCLHDFFWLLYEFRFVFVLGLVYWRDFYAAKFEGFVVDFVGLVDFWVLDIDLEERDV